MAAKIISDGNFLVKISFGNVQIPERTSKLDIPLKVSICFHLKCKISSKLETFLTHLQTLRFETFSAFATKQR